MKKVLSLALALTMCLGILSACGGQANTPGGASQSAANPGSGSQQQTTPPANAITVKFGNSGAIGEPAPETCQYFCDLCNEALGGRYYFEFYPAEQLGNETTMLENLQVGLQEGMMCALDTLATYAPDLNILSMAFAFDSYDNMIAYLKSDVANPIWEKLDSQGLQDRKSTRLNSSH